MTQYRHKPKESSIERAACDKILLELGVFSIKLAKTQESGYPDREFLVPGGRPLFIEFKRPGGKEDATQLMIHERLRHAGYEVETHDTVQGAFEAVKARLTPAGRRGRRST